MENYWKKKNLNYRGISEEIMKELNKIYGIRRHVLSEKITKDDIINSILQKGVEEEKERLSSIIGGLTYHGDL